MVRSLGEIMPKWPGTYGNKVGRPPVEEKDRPKGPLKKVGSCEGLTGKAKKACVDKKIEDARKKMWTKGPKGSKTANPRKEAKTKRRKNLLEDESMWDF